MINDIFTEKKPIVALLHLDALPGDPLYGGSMDKIISNAAKDLLSLQEGGVDGILFANEFSTPYMPETEMVTIAAMARIIGELKHDISIPFGVNVVLNPMATIELAAATGAVFCRNSFTGAFTGEYGLYLSGDGKVIRRKKALGLDNLKLFYKANTEGDAYLGSNNAITAATNIIKGGFADAVCVSGLSAGEETDDNFLASIHDIGKRHNVPVFCNTGCNISNVSRKLAISDGAFIGTGLKKDGKLTNHIDLGRVKEFMSEVNKIRKENN